MGKQLPKTKKRVAFYCFVSPSTLKLIKQFAKDDSAPEGHVLDGLAQLRAAGESFGLGSVRLSSAVKTIERVPDGLRNGEPVMSSEVVELARPENSTARMEKLVKSMRPPRAKGDKSR